MNTELFIAKRMLKKEKHSKKISKPIVWISIAGISLGLAVMIITISIAAGFQSEIKHLFLNLNYNTWLKN